MNIPNPENHGRLALELVDVILDLKDCLGFKPEDRVEVGVEIDSDELAVALFPYAEYIMEQTQCDALFFEASVYTESYLSIVGDFEIEVSVDKSRLMV